VRGDELGVNSYLLKIPVTRPVVAMDNLLYAEVEQIRSMALLIDHERLVDEANSSYNFQTIQFAMDWNALITCGELVTVNSDDQTITQRSSTAKQLQMASVKKVEHPYNVNGYGHRTPPQRVLTKRHGKINCLYHPLKCDNA
jgi:hypothetical protein